MENSKEIGLKTTNSQHTAIPIPFKPSNSFHQIESSPEYSSKDPADVTNNEADNDKNENKKRKQTGVIKQKHSIKKRKLTILPDSSNSNSSSDINLNISEVADGFLKIIKAEYSLQEHFEVTSDSEKSESEKLTTQMPTSYKLEASIKLSSAEILSIKTICIEDFYQTIAKALLKKTVSVIPLVEYFISINYDWRQTGKFNEILMHYLVTLPDGILAFDKFDIEKQRDLLQTNVDRELNNPLLILAKLYAKDLCDIYYKNLKACFKIIYDFDNDFVSYLHLSVESSNDSDDSYENSQPSAIDILIERLEFVLSNNQITITVKNYLEILAMMCVHCQEEDLYLAPIQDTFKKYKLNNEYSLLFNKYYQHYVLENQTLFNDFEEQTNQVEAKNFDQKYSGNTNLFFNTVLTKESAISNKEDELKDYKANQVLNNVNNLKKL